MLRTDSSEDSAKNETNTNQHDFLERPIVKSFIHSMSQRLRAEEIAPPEPEPPTVKDKVKTIILPALVVVGLGGLAIAYPNLLNDFDLHYLRGNDSSAIVIVLFVLFFKLAWNQIGGGIAIALSLIAIVRSLIPTNSNISTPEPIEPHLLNDSPQ